MAFVKVCALKSLPPGTVTEVRLDDRVFALCNHEGAVHALAGVCPHAHGPLGHGIMNAKYLVCPWHFWGFDCETGENDYDPHFKLERFAVKLSESEIFFDPEAHA